MDSSDEREFVEPPSVSDGFDGELQARNYFSSVYTDVTRYVPNSVRLRHFGEEIYQLRHDITNRNAYLARLPKGYALAKGKKQNYIYGHPSGARYQTMSSFLPHLLWLEKIAQKQTVKCNCKICTARGGTTVSNDDDDTSTKKDIRRVDSPKVVVNKNSKKAIEPYMTSEGSRQDLNEVFKVEKIILVRKYEFPSLPPKAKRRKEDYGLSGTLRKVNSVDLSSSSIKDLKPFVVPVPVVVALPETDYLLEKKK